MATVSKAEAARHFGISRTTLYKFLDQGKLSATPDGLIDTAELVRVMSTMDVHGERLRTSLGSTAMDIDRQGREQHERPERTSSEHQEWTSSERQLTSSYRDMVDILREQLHAAQERERDYREHIARLTAMLDQAHQQNQRLLDMPRPAQASHPVGSSEGVRGAMRQRILELLRAYPDGLSPAQIRQLLGVDKDLGSTMKAMARDGRIRRVEHGRYAAP